MLRTTMAIAMTAATLAPCEALADRERIDGLYVCNKTDKTINIVVAEYRRPRNFSRTLDVQTTEMRYVSTASDEAGVLKTSGITAKWTYHPPIGFGQIRSDQCDIRVGEIRSNLHSYYWFAFNDERTWDGGANAKHSFCMRRNVDGSTSLIEAARCSSEKDKLYGWIPIKVGPTAKRVKVNVE